MQGTGYTKPQEKQKLIGDCGPQSKRFRVPTMISVIICKRNIIGCWGWGRPWPGRPGRTCTNNGARSSQADSHSNWTPGRTTTDPNCCQRKNPPKSYHGDRQNPSKSQPDFIGAKIPSLQGPETTIFGGREKGKANPVQIPHPPPEGARSPAPPREPGTEMVGKKLSMSNFPAPKNLQSPNSDTCTVGKILKMPNLSAQKILPSPNLQAAFDRNKLNAPTCPFQGPKAQIVEWEKLGPTKSFSVGFCGGSRGHCTPFPPMPPRNCPKHPLMMTTIGEYLQQGVLKKLSAEEKSRTKHWVPIFPRPKKDPSEIRIITDLRELNTCFQTPKHRAETWKNVLQTLENRELTWGITLDLKSWFHHLELHPKIQRWMRIQVGEQAYQMTAMPFGWTMSPWWSNKLSKPIRKWLNRREWPFCWWVDDILLLGTSPPRWNTEPDASSTFCRAWGCKSITKNR